LLWPAAQQLNWLLHACTAGVIARTVSDVMLFNSLFSDCSEAYPEVELKGMRIGYPTNFWADLGDEVSAPPFSASLDVCHLLYVSALKAGERGLKQERRQKGSSEVLG
jgi:hypothetical protein